MVENYLRFISKSKITTNSLILIFTPQNAIHATLVTNLPNYHLVETQKYNFLVKNIKLRFMLKC